MEPARPRRPPGAVAPTGWAVVAGLAAAFVVADLVGAVVLLAGVALVLQLNGFQPGLPG